MYHIYHMFSFFLIYASLWCWYKRNLRHELHKFLKISKISNSDTFWYFPFWLPWTTMTKLFQFQIQCSSNYSIHQTIWISYFVVFQLFHFHDILNWVHDILVISMWFELKSSNSPSEHIQAITSAGFQNSKMPQLMYRMAQNIWKSENVQVSQFSMPTSWIDYGLQGYSYPLRAVTLACYCERFENTMKI